MRPRFSCTASIPRAHSSNSPGSAITPCLTTSAMPERSSASGRVCSVSRSANTRRGGWNAPTRFFPSGRSKPVLPPMEASIIASRVVGRLTQGMPRIKVAAANPARSPTTPPPRAITVLERSRPASRKPCQREETVSRVLCPSPAGMTSEWARNPEACKDLVVCCRYRGATLESLTTIMVAPRPRPASISPRWSRPVF